MLKISIITVTYNSAKTLEDTLSSVMKQSYGNIEYIIIDGGSTDHTMEMVQPFRSRIAHVVQEPDNGIYDALNKGIMLATGDIIGILHSDDVFNSTDTIAHVMQDFSTLSVDSVYGDLVYINYENSRIVRYWESGDFYPRRLKFGWMPPHPAFYVKKSIYQKYGLFDTSYKISADYDLMLRFLYHGKISTVYLPEVLVKMRCGGTSNKNLKNILVKSREDLRAIRTNDLGGFYTLACKNLFKLPQLLRRPKYWNRSESVCPSEY